MKRFWPIIAAAGLVALTVLISARADTGLGVDSIRQGNHNCPHCVLKGADLTNQCVKGGNLTGADFDNTKLVVACMSKANFHGASFRNADLSGANLTGSTLVDADLSGANLNITTIKGSDLSRAKGLTQAQLNSACGDAKTRLPAGLTVHRCD